MSNEKTLLKIGNVVFLKKKPKKKVVKIARLGQIDEKNLQPQNIESLKRKAGKLNRRW